MKLKRRQLLQFASSLAAGSLLSHSSTLAADEQPKFKDNPFKLGIASGDPLPDGFVLWTRLLSAPYDVLSTGPRPISVSWQIAADAKMKKLVRSGISIARPENAHAVHVDVSELNADSEYYYQFTAGKFRSPVGRAITAPLFGAHVTSFRFAFASCQDVAGGFYGAYRDLVEQDPRLVIHTGDYIYETEWTGGLRRIPVSEAFLLDDYRNLYSRYKLDPDLQRAHAHCPWLMIMDDHEIDDNWGGDYSNEAFTEHAMSEVDYVKRKTAAFKAYYEHMPLRLAAKVRQGGTRLYQNTVIGDLIQFSLLDCRQYRDLPPCIDNNGEAPRRIASCDEADTTNRSMLGTRQETWLGRSLGSYGARWNSLVQMSVMAPLDHEAGPGLSYNPDGWDGFAANRQRIMDVIKAKQVSNPISLGGDIHAFYAGIVNSDVKDFDSAPLLSEFVCTSISSGGGGNARYQDVISKENAPLKYFENRVRGYALCDVTHKQLTVKMRKVENVLDPDTASSTLKTLVVEAGKAGVLT